MSDVIRSLGIEINLTGNADDELREWAKELREARGAALGFTDNMNDLEKEMLEAAKKIGLTEGQLKELIDETRRGREIQDFAQKYGFSIDQIKQKTEGATESIATFGNAMRALAAAGLIRGLFGAASEMVQVAARYEQTATSFEVMLGSAERARDVLKQLTDFSNATPFTPEEVTTAGRSLMAMGVPAERLIDTMRMVGDVASGVSMDFNELAQIWGKNLASGTVQMEDLNQLAGRGIPIMKELSKVFFGNDQQVQQVRELSSRGQISFKHLEQAFRNMTSQGGTYFGMMDRQSRTALGLWSTLTGNIDETKRQIGMMLMEALKPLLDLLVKVTGWLVNTKWAMNVLKIIFLAAIPVIIGISIALVKSLIPAIVAATVKFWGMAAATIAATWPFILLSTIIIGLIIIIEDLYVWITGGQSLIGEWLGSFSDFAAKIKNIFIGLWEKIKAIFVGVVNFFKNYGKYFIMAIFPLSALYFYWGQIVAFFRSIPDRVISFFSSIPERIVSYLSSLGTRIRDALTGILPGWAVNFIARVSEPSRQSLQARASGGPVSAGSTYLVGEEGPELFTPSRSGYIIPNGAISAGRANIVISPVLNFNAPVRREDAEYVRDVVSRVLSEIATRIEGGVRAGLGLEVG
jgi:tape measure domain-containing protein